MKTLPPIDLKEDKRYEAKEFKTEIEYRECRHTDVKLNETRTELMCKCGVSWTGPRLQELERLFLDRNEKII
jgi:hypothetical protein